MGSRIKNFTDLEVWQIARDVRNEIYLICKKLPVEEKYNLSIQMRKAAVSLTANIAEGYGRFHFQENIQFLRTSRGSAYELMDHIITCQDQNYIALEKASEINDKLMHCIRLLDGLIRYLKKSKEKVD